MVLRIVNGKNHRDILKGFIPVTMGSHKGHQASVMIMDMENVRFFLKVPDPLQRGDLKTEKTFLFIPVRVPGEWIQIDAGAVKPGGYIEIGRASCRDRVMIEVGALYCVRKLCD